MYTQRIWRLIPWLVALLILAGCASPSGLDDALQAAQQGNLIVDVLPSNRLLVQDVDGNLYTILADGTRRFMLTTDAGPQRQYLQPTWSPSGDRIAWTELDNSSGEVRSTLIVAKYNGQDILRLATTPYAPFYLYWSPDEGHLAYLSNWLTRSEPSIALRLVDLAAADTPVRTLAEGAPLYFSWSPDGAQLVTHIANARLELQSIEGDAAPLSTTTAAFPSPQWSADGHSLIYALDGDTTQQLVAADLTGAVTTRITDFDNRISFSLSPDGERLAYVISPEEVALAALGPLYVVDLATQRTRELSTGPVLAFFWSPDSAKLAYLVAVRSDGSLGLRWMVWDGVDNRAYAEIAPTLTFLRSYLAFFDQYAQSMSLWSPDSTAFAYAAVNPVNGSSIWVQHLDADAPVRIGRGVFAAWSPR